MKINKAGKIVSINPPYAIPGGEIIINCENFEVGDVGEYGCYFDGKAARIVGASANRVIVIAPDNFDTTEVEVYLESGGDRSETQTIVIGEKLADDLHIVANPAIDPKDDSLILTRSGSRGQQLPVTLFRHDSNGFVHEMSAEVLNPTGIAFDKSGELFVTARADGEVVRVSRGDEEVVPYASDLGIATGIAFDENDSMFVGDRSGTIYRVPNFGVPESFAVLEPSVSAYHLAFGADSKLYVTAPGLASFDAVYRVDQAGFDEVFFRGLGRPQGLAFDRDGNLYVAACLQGRHGIVKISDDGNAEIFVAGMNLVGLCFTRRGELIAATNEAVYRLPIGVQGVLLN